MHIILFVLLLIVDVRDQSLTKDVAEIPRNAPFLKRVMYFKLTWAPYR